MVVDRCPLQGYSADMGAACMQGESRTVLASSANGDPMDLLDAGATRQMQRASGAGPRRSADDYARGSDGRMIIQDEDAPPGQHNQKLVRLLLCCHVEERQQAGVELTPSTVPTVEWVSLVYGKSNKG